MGKRSLTNLEATHRPTIPQNDFLKNDIIDCFKYILFTK